MHADFCMIFYKTVKQQNIHFTAKFYLISLKTTKLCCLNQNNPPPFLIVKRTVLGSLKLSIFKPAGLAHLDNHAGGAMPEKHHKLQPKPTTTDELKVAQQTIWEELTWLWLPGVVTSFKHLQ